MTELNEFHTAFNYINQDIITEVNVNQTLTRFICIRKMKSLGLNRESFNYLKNEAIVKTIRYDSNPSSNK